MVVYFFILFFSYLFCRVVVLLFSSLSYLKEKKGKKIGQNGMVLYLMGTNGRTD